MPEKKRGGGQPASPQGHAEEARLVRGIDVAFDVQTIIDTHAEIGKAIAGRRAASDHTDRQLAALWRQQGAAIVKLLDGLERATYHDRMAGVAA